MSDRRASPWGSPAPQVDRLFDWRSEKDAPIRESLEAQKSHVAAEFEQRLAASILNLNEQVPPVSSRPLPPLLCQAACSKRPIQGFKNPWVLQQCPGLHASTAD